MPRLRSRLVNSGAEEAGFGVQDHFDGHADQHRVERRLRPECRHERAARECRQDFRRDAAADEHATCRDIAESEVARFRAVRFDENRECLDTPIAPVIERGRGNHRRGIGIIEVDLGSAGMLMRDRVDVQEAAPRHDVLDVYATEALRQRS